MNLNTLIYLTEVSVLTSIFYLFYRYLYFKLAYFEWSRYYLYAVLIFSLIIPILPGVFQYEGQNISTIHIFRQSGSETINGFIPVNNKPGFDLSLIVNILLIIWISGIVRYLFLLIKHLVSLSVLIKKGEKTRVGKYTFVKTDFRGSVFSFFNFIFLNKNFETLGKTEREQIITHEKIHARQMHSLDNLIFEINRAVFWFNPISKLIAADIKIVHEFIVDNIITGNKNKPDYSKLIVKLSSRANNYATTCHFSKEEIKNRIKLISFPESEKIRKRRFVISVPVLILSLFASWFIVSSANNYIKPESKKEKPFQMPFDKNTFKRISPYFEHKTINNTIVSHPETTYELKSFSTVYTIEDGIISDIKTKDIFGLKEITISEKLKSGFIAEYSGLYQSFVRIGDSVKTRTPVGKSGDVRLYPTICIKLSKNGKTYDPEKFY